MSVDYTIEARLLTQNRLKLISEYYQQWEGNYSLNLKFRYLKAFVLDMKTNQSHWILLHRWANKRRISNEALPNILRELISKELYPIRVFQSVCEWMAPHEIDRREFLWLLKSNLLPIETDISFSQSLSTAKIIAKLIEGDRMYVYSGNKSIHIWWQNFQHEKYLKKSELNYGSSARNREKYDRLARKRFIIGIQKHVNDELDERNAIDTKRVVPIIDSLNGFTGNRVVQLNETKFQELTTSDILNLAKVK